MPDRIKIFLAQTRKPVPPPMPSPPIVKPGVKSMLDKWAEHKRGDQKPKNENPGSLQGS